MPQKRYAEALRAYNPSWREKLGNKVYEYARMLGGSPTTAQQYRGVAEFGSDFVPGFGDILGFNDAYRDYKNRNYGWAAANLGLGAIGLVPGVGDAMQAAGKKGVKKARQGIRAFHGSPHDFDKFSMEHIGTGEGVQAYGHGLYFAETPEVAETYQKGLARTHFGSGWAGDIAEEALKSNNGDYAAAAKSLREELAEYGSMMDKPSFKDMTEAARMLESGKTSWGHMYEVNINADPEDFLDWDAPLSEQPQIRDKLNEFEAINYRANKRLAYDIKKMAEAEIKDQGKWQGWLDTAQIKMQDATNPGQARAAILDTIDVMTVAGADDAAIRRVQNIADNLPDTYQLADVGKGHEVARDLAFAPEMVEQLSQAGIPGIKYYDQGSRAAGEGTRNYVVFDDSLIEIVRKYGIAALLGAGVLSQADAEALAAQGYE